MEFYLWGFLYCFFICGLCESEIPLGFQVSLPLPSMYNMTFIGRAFFMETGNAVPNFRVALCVEPVNGRYACSLKVFLQNFQVWNSGHFSQFFPKKRCRLILTTHGDLQMRGSKGKIGWRSATNGQGVEKLQLLKTGNLILTDAMDHISWQSFNFPTNVMLWGQKLTIATRLTSFSTNTTFLSLEIQSSKIALYFNSGIFRYSYWEFRPSISRNITFTKLGSAGLKLFDGEYRKFAQILPRKRQPLSFIALGSNTGNLEFYHYSQYDKRFEASFQVFNTTCDLPLACGPYGVCTFSNSCACIQVSTNVYTKDPNCEEGFSGGFCNNQKSVEMVEIGGVSTIFKVPPRKINVSKEECVSLCIDNCTCVAMVYSITGGSEVHRECFHYELVRGLKQVKQRVGMSYLIKVPKGVVRNSKSSKVRRWLLLMGWVVNGIVIFVVFGGFLYYLLVVRKKRRTDPLESTENT